MLYRIDLHSRLVLSCCLLAKYQWVNFLKDLIQKIYYGYLFYHPPYLQLGEKFATDPLPPPLNLSSAVNLEPPSSLQIVIVEDNSKDQTRKIAHQLAKHYSSLNITVIQRERKLGLGSAYREGAKACKGEFVIIMDADLSHHPKYIPLMIEKQRATGCDIVTCSRYRKGGGVEGWSFWRKLTSRTANFVTKFALGVDCSDFTGSFRLYRKQRLEELMSSTKTKGYSFQMEILVRAHRKNLKVEELPIVFVDRLFGESKLGASEVLIYLRGVAELLLEE